MSTMMSIMIVIFIFAIFFVKRFHEQQSCLKDVAKKRGTSVKEVKRDLKEFFSDLENKIFAIYGIRVKLRLSPIILGGDILNANSSLYHLILISPDWAKKIYEDERCKKAFVHTIGHEVGHKREHLKGQWGFSKRAKTINYIRETNCDFGGIEFAMKYLDLSREEVLSLVEFKVKNFNKKEGSLDKSDSTHPSWNFRLRLMKELPAFDEKAVYIINETNKDNIDVEKIAKKIVKVQL